MLKPSDRLIATTKASKTNISIMLERIGPARRARRLAGVT
jgi:hypothetical protein